MASGRKGIFLLFLLTCICCWARAQTVYYPAGSSSVLRSTAKDIAQLFTRAIPGNNFSAEAYTSLPASGIIFIYDSTITGNSNCKAESNGSSFIKFSAAQDNGLIFGIYQYLNELGFRFYQPGTIWELIPALTSVYKNVNRFYNNTYKYRAWFISGGHNRWIMDNDPGYGWDTYFGLNGHNWALYQRRNGMLGSYRFAGHRGDLMTGSYISTLQQNPCYVACYDGSRNAGPQSVPDVNNVAAMDLWSSTIEEKYTTFRNTIFGNSSLYADYYYNFNYNYDLIGIEVPDGSQWGNSSDQSGCLYRDYESESNQQFTLAYHSAQKLNTLYPGKHLQLYAYSSHANVPSSYVPIANNLDIQVVPTAFQNETSAKGLMNRWYNRTNHISEYHYLNIPQWGGETPMFHLSEFKNTLQRIKENNSQGILWEASPAKFASLPFLWAANKNLLFDKPIDSCLAEFTNTMFGSAAGTVFRLLKQWSADNTITVGDFIQDNKYKLPHYFQQLEIAVNKTSNAPEIIKQRLQELKAYLHYMKLYYDYLFEQDNAVIKKTKAAAVCLYLARINKMQLVNSYFIITDIVSRYNTADPFYTSYNTTNGTAYLDGNLPLISMEEIDADFMNDLGTTGNSIPGYHLKDDEFIAGKIESSNILPATKINVKIGYTNGAGYPNRSEFYIRAKSAGNFTLNYTCNFYIPAKGMINFTLESADKAMEIVKDITLHAGESTEGQVVFDLPHAGTYKLSVVSKQQSSVDLQISCNGNLFYKNSAFLGNKTENYRQDLNSLPGYFYIPAGLQKVFFSINNSNPGGTGYATAKQVSDAFIFKDSHGKRVEPILANPSDSALFFLEIPDDQSGSFWQVFKMEQYNLCFANISNMLVYANRIPCTTVDFRISINIKNGNCLTHLAAVSNTGQTLRWEIYDNGRWMYYGDVKEIDLPDYVSPNSYVSLFADDDCIVTKRLADAPGYYRAKEACASGAALPVLQFPAVVYPNPSKGIYYVLFNGVREFCREILVFNAQGKLISQQYNSNEINITTQAPGIYLYRLVFDDKIHRGKLLKL